jgi:uncharacterized protein YndB with AHSA1/START domain
MIKKILIGIAALILIFLIVVALQAGPFKISRSATVSAAPAAVFEQVNDFHKWDAWSPWAKLDPAMKTTFEGPASGEGSTYGWTGDSKVGEGKMTVVKSQSPELVVIRLEFIKPMAQVSMTEFNFKPEGQGTAVTWSMSGTNNFIGKAFCMFMNMEKIIGPDFEKGLAELKTVAEKK